MYFYACLFQCFDKCVIILLWDGDAKRARSMLIQTPSNILRAGMTQGKQCDRVCACVRVRACV
jgi:hypothetical protein